MLRKLIVISLIILSASGLSASDDAISPKVSVDRKRVLIGDRILLSIEVRKAKGLELLFPKFENNRIGQFELMDTKDSERSFFGRTTTIRSYGISSYEVGKNTIPGLEIRYRHKFDKDWKVAKTNAIDITVESALPKGVTATDIREIKGPKGPLAAGWIFLILGAMSAAVIIIFSVSALKKRFNKPARLPHETALEEVEAARAALLKDGNIKDYYVGISDTVRRYIERVLNLRASEMTTPEFLESLKGSNSLRAEQKDILKSFLNACDLVKFAKYEPTKNEIELVYLTAKRFIEESRDHTKEAEDKNV